MSIAEFLWYALMVFCFVAYLFILFFILTDLFRDHKLSGWWKAVWILFLIFLPFITALAYLIFRGKGMGERAQQAQADAIAAQNAYIKQVAAPPPQPTRSPAPRRCWTRCHHPGGVRQDQVAGAVFLIPSTKVMAPPTRGRRGQILPRRDRRALASCAAGHGARVAGIATIGGRKSRQCASGPARQLCTRSSRRWHGAAGAPKYPRAPGRQHNGIVAGRSHGRRRPEVLLKESADSFIRYEPGPAGAPPARAGRGRRATARVPVRRVRSPRAAASGARAASPGRASRRRLAPTPPAVRPVRAL